MKRYVVAGAALVAELTSAREALPKFNDEALCALQRAEARRGILGVEIAESMYGWSVRYNSGLQNFALLASSRRGDLDGTYEAAEKFAIDWVAADPERRYAEAVK